MPSLNTMPKLKTRLDNDRISKRSLCRLFELTMLQNQWCSPLQWISSFHQIGLCMGSRNKQSYPDWQTTLIECRSFRHHNEQRIFLQHLQIQEPFALKKKTIKKWLAELNLNKAVDSLLTRSAISSRRCWSFFIEPVDLFNLRKTTGDSGLLAIESPEIPDSSAIGK